jgi:hypothetical protein
VPSPKWQEIGGRDAVRGLGRIHRSVHRDSTSVLSGRCHTRHKRESVRSRDGQAHLSISPAGMAAEARRSHVVVQKPLVFSLLCWSDLDEPGVTRHVGA